MKKLTASISALVFACVFASAPTFAHTAAGGAHHGVAAHATSTHAKVTEYRHGNSPVFTPLPMPGWGKISNK